MTSPLLGCIADDFTGATDLASNLVAAGLRVIQTNGIPTEPLDEPADAVVVALKTRTISADAAVAQSLAALSWLRAQGAGQIYFKYCSTFDSTPHGNIGPVADALMDAMGVDFTIACPAFPDNGRTVFKGYLFVGDGLLHESGMCNHPLTPMTDSNLVRVLQAQTRRTVGLIDHRTVAQGADAVRQRMTTLRQEGVGMAVVDAVSNADLLTLGAALKSVPLLTAGSGIAIGLGDRAGHGLPASDGVLPGAKGFRAIVSGSCSEATLAQVADFVARGGAVFSVDPLALAQGVNVPGQALEWAHQHLPHGPVLVCATAAPDAVRAVQARLGAEAAGNLVEEALAAVARGLVGQGVGQLVVAGGETSGACVQALGLNRLLIGPAIAPGVPWCHARCALAPGGSLHIALKSGNFGSPDFFTRAFAQLTSGV